ACCVAVTDPESAAQADRSRLNGKARFLIGTDGAVAIARDPEVDFVVSAIVGAAGLEGTWAALEAGKTVGVANKETLVMAGPLVMELARKRNATLLPINSEHSAIFQAMRSGQPHEVE